MKKEFKLEIVTPDRLVLREEGVEEFSAPGAEGYFTALPEHTPYLVMLSEGILSYRKGKSWYYLTVMNGFVEVLPDEIRVLAEKSESTDDIDLKRAEEAKKRAEKKLSDAVNSEIDFERAQMALRRAIIRLNAKKSSRF